MFQTENERDYSGTMSGIPIEPLLTIIKSRDTTVGTEDPTITASSYVTTDYATDDDPTTSNSINNIIMATPLNDKMKTRISRSSDSGYPNSPSLVRERSLRRQHRNNDDSDSSSTDIGVSIGSVVNASTTSSFPRSVSSSAATKSRNNSKNHYNHIATRNSNGSSHKNEHIPLAHLDHSSSTRGRSRSLNSSNDTVFSSDRSVSSSATLNPKLSGVGGRGGRYSESDSYSASTMNNNGGGGYFNNNASATVKAQRRISKGSTCSMEISSTNGASTTNKTGASSMATSSTNGGGGGIVARHIAMRMLAASSRSYKLQEELAKPRILKLLLDCLVDPDDEIILQAAETLANIAMNIETHLQLQVENTEEGLYKLLEHPSLKIQYQAARGLVYLGYQDVNGRYIYNFIPGEDSSSTVVYMEEEGRSHIRGTTVENLVLTLTQTKGIYLLWGGAHNLPPSPSQRKSSRHHHHHSSLSGKPSSSKTVPSENQIVNFILSTYQTFVHPIIFMRLLLHRFHEPAAYERFATPKLLDVDSVNDGLGGATATGSGPMEHYAPLPIVHARLMRVWIAWLENYADDFRTFPTLRDELSVLVGPMRSIDGPYAPCASRLEQLLAKTATVDGSWPANNINVYHFESESHHNILYEQCYKVL